MGSTGVNDNKSHEILLMDLITQRAMETPDEVWMIHPKLGTSESPFFNITYQMLLNAIDSMAWFLQENVPSKHRFETLAFIGINDARYTIIFYAAMKTGFKIFFPSPKNSLNALTEMMRTLDCTTLLITDPQPGSANLPEAHDTMTILSVPILQSLFDSSPRHFPYDGSFEKSKKDPIVALHTSGSTGQPKPLVYTHEFWASNANAFQLPVAVGYKAIGDLLAGARFICLFPLFHMAGHCWVSTMSIFFRSTVILPPLDAPPSDETICNILTHNQADWAAVAPATLNSIGENPDSLKAISQKLSDLVVMGGKPTREMGNTVAQKIRIHNLIGSSECGGFPQLLPVDESIADQGWEYIRFHPDAKPDFRSHGSGFHELFITREPACKAHQPVFIQYPDLDEFGTKDLFERHPSLHDHWRHVGRVDDIIVFLNGEKTNPVTFESHMLGHGDINGALVFGTGRMEAGLLIELKDGVLDAADPSSKSMIDKIWPKVDEANSQSPSYARISKSTVIIAKPGKRFARNAKGTVRRQETLNVFQHEIEAVYNPSENLEDARSTETHDEYDFEEIQHRLRQAYDLAVDGKLPAECDNFFSAGMDSLQALRFSQEISRAGLRNVNTKTIYTHPSMKKLATAIYRGQTSPNVSEEQDDPEKDPESMRRVLDHYTEKVNHLVQSVERPDRNSMVGNRLSFKNSNGSLTILITGTTGFVGSYILNRLLDDPSSPRIICLNRAENGEEAQSRNNGHRDSTLATSFPQDRVTFLSADLAASETCGLNQTQWEQLKENVDVVIHLSWPVDFNLSLSSFRPSLDGLVNLIHFCQIGHRSPALLFISSISSAIQLSESVIPEDIINDTTAPMPGYGESKYVGEHLVKLASEHLHVRTAIVRLGQVAGSVHSGRGWNERDWLPRLVKSSCFLGAIPESLGKNDEIDWTPIDVVAKVVRDIAVGIPFDSGCHVLNVVNPQTISWHELLPALVNSLNSVSSSNTQVTRVSSQRWLDILHKSLTDDSKIETGEQNPAANLLEFFQEMFHQGKKGPRKFSTIKTTEVSRELRDLGSIRPEWMRSWAEDWVKA